MAKFRGGRRICYTSHVSPRRSYAVFLAAVGLLAVASFFAGRASRKTSGGVLSLVPEDAWLVVTVDVEALRSSGLAVALAGTKPIGALGQCGFDPLARVHEIVVASPEGGEKGDFGLAFRADASRAELEECANKAIGARGGKALTRSRADFTVIEDASDPGHARLAYREGGPFLVGRGEWLDRMIDLASRPPGTSGGGEPGTTHSELRTSLSRGGTPALLLTAILPKDLRERLKGELGTELGTEADRAYASVLSVQAGGAALTTGPTGSMTTMEAELRCETAAACDDVKGVIERKRAAFSRSPAARLVGLGSLLDSLHVEEHGAALSLTARVPTDELTQALGRVLPVVGDAPPQAN
jgi:hypothetical protein